MKVKYKLNKEHFFRMVEVLCGLQMDGSLDPAFGTKARLLRNEMHHGEVACNPCATITGN